MDRILVATQQLMGSRCYRFKSDESLDRDDTASVVVGIPGFCAEIRYLRKRLNQNGAFDHHFSDVNCRILDAPIAYEVAHVEVPELLLEGAILPAIFSRFSEDLEKYLTGQLGNIDLSAWSPPEWAGKSLVIPVDYIEIENLEWSLREEDVITASICVGHHLVFWRNRIVRDKQIMLENSPIIHEEIQEIIISLLKKAGLDDLAAGACMRGGYTLFTGMPNCNKEIPTPVYFK